MHVFHIRGLSSIFLLLLTILGAGLLFLALPASFMMVLWNALIFEGAKGPEINLYQGFLLWGMVLVVLKLVFKPEIQLEFVKPAPGKNGNSKPLASVKSKKEAAQKGFKEAVKSAPTATLEKQAEDSVNTDSSSPKS